MIKGKERDKDRPVTSFTNPRTDERMTYAKKVEKQLMENTKIKAEDILDREIAPYLEI